MISQDALEDMIAERAKKGVPLVEADGHSAAAGYFQAAALAILARNLGRIANAMEEANIQRGRHK